MEFANRLLPAVTTEVSVTDSIRTEGDEPRLLRVNEDDVFATAWTEAAALVVVHARDLPQEISPLLSV